MTEGKDINAILATQTEDVLKNARTVTGNNIKGSARVLSMDELRKFVSESVEKFGGTDEEEIQRREDALRAESAEKEKQLQDRIRELEALSAQSGVEKDEAVASALSSQQDHINKLQAILDNDDARSRAAFLEQEVARLQAMMDRYKSGLETITAVENPDIADDIQLCAQLAGTVQGDLSIRMSDIKLGIEGAKRALDEGISAIVHKDMGTIYSCFDLLEHSVALRHYRHELRSIQQAQ